MKKFLSSFIIFAMLLVYGGAGVHVSAQTSVPTIAARSAIVMDESTGNILYNKNKDSKVYPASTTKILTALIVLEKLNLNKVLTASKTACSIPSDASNVGIKPGEKMTVKNLLYAMMVSSSCESANILAEGVAGSIPKFVVMMNKRAKQLGATHSNFVNAHGYDDPKHYTTAYDMLLISRQAMKNYTFRAIVSTVSYKIPATNVHKQGITLKTTNKLMIKGSGYYYSYTKGIKTGYTSIAKHNLVSLADKNGKRYLTVVFGSSDAFYDSVKLYNYYLK